MYPLRQMFTMGWGKIRRSFLTAFRDKRVQEKLNRRRGACSRCGACCKLLFNCPAYDDRDGNPKCLIYNDRPGVCSLFPLDEKDLRERDFVMPGKKCGFYFEDTPEPAAGESRESMPAPQASARPNGKVKLRLGTGFAAIILLMFRKPQPKGSENVEP